MSLESIPCGLIIVTRQNIKNTINAIANHTDSRVISIDEASWFYTVRMTNGTQSRGLVVFNIRPEQHVLLMPDRAFRLL